MEYYFFVEYFFFFLRFLLFSQINAFSIQKLFRLLEYVGFLNLPLLRHLSYDV